jgi:RNAse (barnase) inhibitor barstar
MDSLLSLFSAAERASVYRSKLPADEVIAAAKTAGLRVFKIDVGKARGKNDLLNLLAKALEFPDHFGKNWDALHDCLTDLSWLPGKGWVVILLNGDVLARNHEAIFITAVDVFSAAAESWRSQNKPFWVLIQGQAAWEPKLPEIIAD